MNEIDIVNQIIAPAMYNKSDLQPVQCAPPVFYENDDLFWPEGAYAAICSPDGRILMLGNQLFPAPHATHGSIPTEVGLLTSLRYFEFGWE